MKDCPIEKRTCNGAGLRYLNRKFRAVGSGAERVGQRVSNTLSALEYRKFRAVGSGAERVGQRVSNTLSALEYTNLMGLALVLGTLEPGAHRRRVKLIVADLFEMWECPLHILKSL